MNHYFTDFQDMMRRRGFTQKSINAYSTYVRAYLNYCSDILQKDPNDVSWQEMRQFIDWLQHTRTLSDRTVNSAISSLRFFMLYVLHKDWDEYRMPMRKFDTFLPYVPTQEETWQFISTISNLKYKTMLTLIYSAGLRVSEVCNLRYEDVSRDAMRLHIHHSKNRTSRYAVLSRTALDLLADYWKKYGKPMGYLFPAPRNPDAPIPPHRITYYIPQHEKELGWPHRLTCHSFRHAFGTHLYENGVDLITIRNLLGHKSLNSTTIYVHLAINRKENISPLDVLADKYHEHH